MTIAPPKPAVEPTLEERLARAGVPPRFASARLMTFQQRPGLRRALEATMALLDDTTGRNLALSGPPGTGKTHLTVGLVAARLHAWMEAHPKAVVELPDPDPERPWATVVQQRPKLALRFLVVPTFLDQLRAAIRYGDRDDPLPELFDADLVVLDDLGREKVTDWASERLYVLVNERYNRKRSTIVTTNYGANDLADRGYDALVSRLMEGSELVTIDAPDYRIAGGR